MSKYNVQELSNKLGLIDVQENGQFVEDNIEYIMAIMDYNLADLLHRTGHSTTPNVYSVIKLDKDNALVRIDHAFPCFFNNESLNINSDEEFRGLLQSAQNNIQVPDFIKKCNQALLSFNALLDDNDAVQIKDITLNNFSTNFSGKIFFNNFLDKKIEQKNELEFYRDNLMPKNTDGIIGTDKVYENSISVEELMDIIQNIDNPDNISISISPSYDDDNILYLDSFEKPENTSPGKGLYYLKEVMGQLDKYGFSIELEVRNNQKLIDIYSSAGFVISEDADHEDIVRMMRSYKMETFVMNLAHERDLTKDIEKGFNLEI